MQADIVIVGAGSAGATLAAQLSEDPQLNVLLIEAGEPVHFPWVDIPIGYFKTVSNPNFDWGFRPIQSLKWLIAICLGHAAKV